MSLTYPLQSTAKGDLALCQTADETVKSRIRLYLDCAPGDRPMLESFGSTLQPYAPADFDALQGESLRLGLNRWCRQDGEALEFAVQARSTVLSESRLNISYTFGDRTNA